MCRYARTSPLGVASLLTAMASLTGCDGLIGAPLEPRWNNEVETPLTCDANAVAPPDVSRNVQRLTRLQYAYALHDLLGMTPPNLMTGELPDEIAGVDVDAAIHGYDTNHEALTVTASLFRDYRRVAEAVATTLLQNPAALSALAPCSGGTPRTCAESFLDDVGARAFRRALTADERDHYLSLFDAADGLYASSPSAYASGIALMTEALLQSPHFLYRVELGDEAVDLDGISARQLTSFETASRLAFALWTSIPDAELLEAAAAGELETEAQVRAQAERMMASPKFLRTVSDFIRQWFPAADYGRELRNPPLPDSAGDSMREELVRFAIDNVESTGGDYGALMSASHSFVNQDLAPIYGLQGSFGPELERAELDPTQRAGLLTQLGFLDAFASVTTSAPITRGVFILERVLCRPVPVPDFQIMPPTVTGDITTTRELFAAHTDDPTCQRCHRTINNMGFLFENYGSRGAYRTEERGHPIDSSGTVRMGGEEVELDNAVQLASAMSKDGEAMACYFENWLTYLQGREMSERDHCALQVALDRAKRKGKPTLQAFLVEYMASEASAHRVDRSDVALPGADERVPAPRAPFTGP